MTYLSFLDCVLSSGLTFKPAASSPFEPSFAEKGEREGSARNEPTSRSSLDLTSLSPTNDSTVPVSQPESGDIFSSRQENHAIIETT